MPSGYLVSIILSARLHASRGGRQELDTGR
jgi:hypothetical protein